MDTECLCWYNLSVLANEDDLKVAIIILFGVVFALDWLIFGRRKRDR